MTADLTIVWTLTRHQLIGMTRNRRGLVFTVVMPVLLLVLFNSIFVKGSDQIQV